MTAGPVGWHEHMKIHKRIEREIRAAVANGSDLEHELAEELLRAYDCAREGVPLHRHCTEAGVSMAHAVEWMKARDECVLEDGPWYGWKWGDLCLPQDYIDELVTRLASQSGISKWVLLDEMAALDIP